MKMLDQNDLNKTEAFWSLLFERYKWFIGINADISIRISAKIWGDPEMPSDDLIRDVWHSTYT